MGISAANAAIEKKIYGSGHPLELASRATALIISNEEMEDIMKALKESGLLINSISETIKMKQINKKADFVQSYKEHQLPVY